jgi:hypothetical protein
MTSVAVLAPLVHRRVDVSVELRRCTTCDAGWLAVDHDADRCRRCRRRAAERLSKRGGDGTARPGAPGTGEVKWPDHSHCPSASVATGLR